MITATLGNTEIGLTTDERYEANSWKQIGDLLANAGFPSQVIPWATAQVMLETNGLKSNVSKSDFNLSGIKYVKQAGATQGTKSPEGNYYAKYGSYEAWATDFKRVLSRGANPPIDAASVSDYVSRLSANHYFTSSPGPYLKSLQTILEAAGNAQGQQSTELKKAESNYNITNHSITLKPIVAIKQKWDSLPLWGKIGVGVAGVFVVKKIID